MPLHSVKRMAIAAMVLLALGACMRTTADPDPSTGGIQQASIPDQHLDCAAFNLVAAAYLKSSGGPDREDLAKSIAMLHYFKARSLTTVKYADDRMQGFAEHYLKVLQDPGSATQEMVQSKTGFCIDLFDEFRSG